MDQHHFLTTCIWDALKRNANQTRKSLNNTTRCLNPVFLLEQPRNFQDETKPRAKTSAWSHDMEGHAQKCVERYCKLANKKVGQLYKVSSPCLDDHQFKQEELESVGELPEVCSQFFLECLYLARIGRPDIFMVGKKLARSVTKWTQACDRRLASLISKIHHTNEFRQCCHVGNTAQHCRLALFQDSGVLCIFGSRTFVLVSWMCIKQTSVSHSSTESEIISLNARLRVDGLLALDLWDIVIEVLRSTNNTVHLKHTSIQGTGATLHSKTKTPNIRRRQKVEQLNDVDCVPTKTHSSQHESQLYIFEDIEAVIKMIIKGRSLIVRHVSRTHRVALVWLFDRINWDPKIQFKHINVFSSDIDHIPSNTMHYGAGAMLYVFEDNEAVIKMIIKGRSPTMRHVSRTHRVALDWLFDR